MVNVLFAGALFVTLLRAGTCKLSVTRIGSVYLPSQGGNFTLNRRATTCSCFDLSAKIIYSTNGHNMVIIDAKNISDLQTIGRQAFPFKYTFNEIECHGDFVSVVAFDASDPANGQLLILRAWDGQGMDIAQKLKVGSNPTAIMTGPDRKTLFVTDTGRPYEDKNGVIINPPGGIVIFKFKSFDFSKRPSVHRITAKSFNGKADELRRNGVRIQDGVSVAQQFAPVFTTRDEQGDFMYTSLPYMNAVARIDIKKAKLLSIKSLGTFDWTNVPIDTTLARKPNLRPQPMESMFQAREIRFIRDEKNRPRLLLGNEGFINQGEGITGKEIIKQGLLDPSVSDDVRQRLKKSSELGDVIFSATDGLNPDTGYIQVPTSFGTRSFSIRRIRSANLVYDSDEFIEAEIAEYFPKIFNAEVVPNKVVKTTASRASVNIGPGPGSVQIGKDNCGKNLIFVGTRNPGTLHIFSWTKLRKPKFEIVISGVEDPHLTWDELYAQRRTGDLNVDIEGFVSEKDGVKFPFVMVSGIDSGTVSIYEIKNDHC